MKTLRKFILAFIAITIFLFGFFMMRYLASLKKDPPQRPALEVKRYVKSKKVTYKDIETTIESSGRVNTGKNVLMISEVTGKIMQGDFPLKEGRSFKKGQLIYRINNTEAQYNLAAQKSQFLTALAAILPDVKIDFTEHFDKMKSFFDEINIEKDLPPLPDIDDNTFKTFIATKNVLNLYYSIKSAEEKLRKYDYHAPFDGTITKITLEVGSVVNPGIVLGQIISTGEYEVVVPIKVNDISWISKNQKVQLKTDADTPILSGSIIRIGENLDPNTQSINVYVAVNDGDKDGLYDGMYLTVALPGPVVAVAIEIPRKAIFNENNVFTVEGGLLITKPIQIKKLNTNTAIIAGLTEGTIIVTESVANGFENMPVQIDL